MRRWQSERSVTSVTTVAAVDAEGAAGDGDFFELLGAPRREDEIRAAAGQFQRRRAADAARCSRDDDRLVFQRRGHDTRTHITCYASRRCSGASSSQQSSSHSPATTNRTCRNCFPIPDAQLVSEANKPVRMSEMKGNVVVYDFIFTHCAGTCPMMTATMQKLTKKIPKQSPVRFVSISVDPIRDTPEVLRGYAMYARNDPRWMFLTGDRKTIVDLSVKGFKLAAGDATERQTSRSCTA